MLVFPTPKRAKSSIMMPALQLIIIIDDLPKHFLNFRVKYPEIQLETFVLYRVSLLRHYTSLRLERLLGDTFRCRHGPGNVSRFAIDLNIEILLSDFDLELCEVPF